MNVTGYRIDAGYSRKYRKNRKECREMDRRRNTAEIRPYGANEEIWQNVSSIFDATDTRNGERHGFFDTPDPPAQHPKKHIIYDIK